MKHYSADRYQELTVAIANGGHSRTKKTPTRGVLAVGMGVILSFCSLTMAVNPVVSNLRVWQEQGSSQVEILYNLSDPDSPSLTVSIAVSSDDGVTYNVPCSTVRDGGSVKSIGPGVTPGGERWIVWNAGADWSGQFSSVVRIRVAAYDATAPAGMVLIPGGTNAGFQPSWGWYSLQVNSFYMDCYEVTKAKWDEVYTWAIANGYDFDYPGVGKAANHPVCQVNWYDCVKWCNARSQREGRPAVYTVNGTVLKTGQATNVVQTSSAGYRLPTDVEWHYAARGGITNREFPWGDTDTIQHTRANYCSSASYSNDTSATRGYHPDYYDENGLSTSPVGSFAPNGYGLYDMVGNVWEWCSNKENPESAARLICGGSWWTTVFWCNVARSSLNDQSSYAWMFYGDLGFRAVLPLSQ